MASMDKLLERVELKGIECRHNIPIQTGYHGTVKHVVVFIELSTTRTFIWVTTSVDALLYEEGKKYNVKALLDKVNKRLSFVKLINQDSHTAGKVNSRIDF